MRAWRGGGRHGAPSRGDGLIANAASLFGATVITSALGLVFWAAAARLFSVRDVGIAYAAMAAMQLIGTIGVLGLGTLIIGEVRRVADPRALVTTACVVAGVSSLVLGLGLGLVPGLNVHLGALQDSPLGMAVFGVGVGLSGLTVVLDQACVGMLRGGLQFWRNAVFSVVKLVILPAGLLLTDGEVGLYGVWATGNLLSLVTLYVHARRAGLHPGIRVDRHCLSGMWGMALNHHWLNLSGTAPRLLLPLVVVQSMGPESNAAFSAALIFSSFVAIVPVHLSTALFALSRGDEPALRQALRSALKVVVGVTAAATLGAWVLGGFALRVLGPAYTAGKPSLVLLVLAALFSGVGSFYVAVERVRDRLTRASVVTTLSGLLEIGLAIVGSTRHSVLAITVGYVSAQVLTAAVLWPVVANAAGWTHLLPPFLRVGPTTKTPEVHP